MKKLGLAFFILLFTASTSASWSFTPSKIYLDERGAATFTIKSDGGEPPMDFSISVINRIDENVNDIRIYPKIINKAGGKSDTSEVKLRKVRPTEDRFIFLQVKGLDPKRPITFRARIVDEHSE
tara:strand:- start:6666 stop:7037 length:372 start_codon:yes stop_codon:yes gene_type:complete